MISSINIDTIVSDPWLLTASILLVTGPILFLVSLIKFLTTPSENVAPFPFVDESPVAGRVPVDSPISARAESLARSRATPPPPVAEQTPETPAYEEAKPPAEPPAEERIRPPASRAPVDMEKTVVLPAGVADVQAQLDIALTQIKTINRKIHELESQLTAFARNAPKIEASDWKDMPANTADFAQKLLKLAEHVIVLEKEVARLKSERPASPPASKPPIMPL